MAMKKKLTKAEYDKLSDDMKKEYIADGDAFKLDLTDDEDVGPLRRALEREKAAKGTSEARVAELEAQLAELETNDAKKKGDIATLEKQWQKKLDDQKAASDVSNGKLSGFLRTQLVDSVAKDLATKISTAPALLIPHIKARLQADLEGDAPATKILDVAGKVSTMTLDDLQKEFVANKDFAAIIKASNASGGAGRPSNQNGGGAPTNQNNGATDLSKMGAKEMAAYLTERKEAQT